MIEKSNSLSDQIYWNMKTYVVLVLSKFYYYFGLLLYFSLEYFMKHKNRISEEWPFHTFLKVEIFLDTTYKKKCTIVHIIIIIIVFL